MKEEEERRNAAVEAFSVAKKNNQELKKKLLEVEKERKYATVALENAEKQSESQRLLLRTVEDNLATSKTQIVALKKKKLEEVEKARVLTEKAREEADKAKDEAEQHDYDVGMAETEDALRAEVPAVCRTYCALTWDKALNQAGVEASSVLRKAGSVCYPPAICLASFKFTFRQDVFLKE